MALYYKTFDGDTIGQLPSGFAQRIKAVTDANAAVRQSGSYKVFQINNITHGSYVFGYTPLNNVQDVETLTLFRVVSSSRWGRYGINYNRYNGTSEATTRGYNISFTPVDGVASLILSEDAVGSIYWEDYDWSPNSWYYMRLRTVGSRVAYKIWPESSTEPTVWNADFQYSGPSLTNPYSGVGNWVQDSRIEYRLFSAGTNGDSAPLLPPTTHIDTTDGEVFEDRRPGLRFTGTADTSSRLEYEINIEGLEAIGIDEGDITQDPTTAFTAGRTDPLQSIAIHWWNDPALHPTIEGVISWFKNPANEVSAHFVVSDKTIVQMVDMDDTAWHVYGHNRYTVGIEIDPNFPGDTYQTVGKLIDYIRRKTGQDLPIKGHNSYSGNATQCPGTTDLALLESISRNIPSSSVTARSGNSSGFTNLDTPGQLNPFNTGDPIQYRPQIDLKGGSYEFRVRSRDVEGTNRWGAWTSFSGFAVSISTPTVTTGTPASVSYTSASVPGTVTSTGGSDITERGVVYSTSQNPTTGDSKQVVGAGSGTFVASLTNLSDGTRYYARAYAVNALGTSYGDEVSFLTLPITTASVETSEASEVSYTTATVGGEVVNENGSTVTERGVVYSTSQNPTINNIKAISGSGVGEFSISLADLIDGTTFYARAYAINSKGVAYGSQVTFSTTPITSPTVASSQADTIQPYSARISANVTSQNGSTVTERGFVYSTSQNPTIEDSKSVISGSLGEYSTTLSSLSDGTTYHWRAYAVNSRGVSYSQNRTFTTLTVAVPAVTTSPVTAISQTSASTGGIVATANNGVITERGVVYSTSQNPTIANQKVVASGTVGTFNVNLVSLSTNTTYYIRAYATNEKGSGYGSEISFTTEPIAPTIKSGAASGIATDSFTVSGNGITSNPDSQTINEFGVVYSLNQNPTITDNTQAGSGTPANWDVTIDNLEENTTYYARAYARWRGSNYLYGEQITRKTQGRPSVTPVSPAHDGNVSSVRPELDFRGVDPDNSHISYQLQISDINGFSTTIINALSSSSLGFASVSDQKTDPFNSEGTVRYTPQQNLNRGHKYYWRVRGIDTDGSNTWGEWTSVRSFSVSAVPPTVTALTVNNITFSSASIGGEVTSTGGSTVTERGAVYSTSPNPTTADNKTTSGAGLGMFTVNLTGLSDSSRYYVRTYAINAAGVSYSTELEFLTEQTPNPPLVSTGIATSITESTAEIRDSEVILDGTEPVIERGVVFGVSSNPTVDDGKVIASSVGLGKYSVGITGLATATEYYFRAFAINTIGVGYGEEISAITGEPFVPDEGDGHWTWSPDGSSAIIGRSQPTPPHSSVDLHLSDLNLEDGEEYTLYYKDSTLAPQNDGTWLERERNLSTNPSFEDGNASIDVRRNLAANPSSETSVMPYQGGGAAITSRSSDWAKYGTYSSKAVNTTNDTNSRFYLNIQHATTPIRGRTFTVTATCNKTETTITGDRTPRILVVISRTDPVQYQAIYGEKLPSTAGEYTTSFTFTVPDETRIDRIEVGLCTGGQAGSVVYWDGLLVEEIGTALPYFDGSTRGEFGTETIRRNLCIDPIGMSSLPVGLIGASPISGSQLSSVISSEAPSGKYYRQLVDGLTFFGLRHTTQTPSNNNPGANGYPVSPGEVYTFSLYLRSRNRTPGGVDPYIFPRWHVRDINGDAIGSYRQGANIYISSDEWQRVDYTLEIPGGAHYLLYYWEMRGGDSNPDTELHYTSPLVEKTDKALPYFDGSYTPNPESHYKPEWLGTPNASESVLRSGSADLTPAWIGEPDNSPSVLTGQRVTGFDTSGDGGDMISWLSSDGSNHGNRFARVLVRNTQPIAFNNRDTVDVASGELRTSSMYVRSTRSVTGVLRYISSVGFTTSTIGNKSLTANTWTELKDTASPSVTNAGLSMLFSTSPFQAGDIVDFDNHFVVKGDYTGDYFDGYTTPDGDLATKWLGEPNNSESSLGKSEGIVKVERLDSGLKVQDTVMPGEPFTFTYSEDMSNWKIRLFITGDDIEVEDINASFNDLYLAKESEFSGFVPFIANGTSEVKIENNWILDKRREDTIQNIFTVVEGEGWYPLKATTVGLGWYEIGDRVLLQDDKGSREVVIWDTSLTIDGGIKEVLSAKTPDKTETDYKKAGSISSSLKRTQISVDHNEQQILSLVEDIHGVDGVMNTKFSQIEQTVDAIESTVQSSGGVNLIKNSVMFDHEEASRAERENLALNKSVTSSVAPNLNTLERVTNGNTATQDYVQIPEGIQFIQVDLGDIYELNEIRVWHYYSDGRTYYNPKTEVSEDGETWTVVSEPAQYPETSSGHSRDFPPIMARYVRDYIGGSSQNTGNHWVQLEAYATPQFVKSWEVEGGGSLVIQSSPESMSAGGISGNAFTLSNMLVRQEIPVRADTDGISEDDKLYYALSAKVKKNIVGNAWIKVSNPHEEHIIELPNQTDYLWDDVKLEGLLPVGDHYLLEIWSDDDADLQVTDLMLSPGESTRQWTQANGEVMNTSVVVNDDGVTVRSNIYRNDFTRITALGFEVHKHDASGDRIFGFNGDETNVYKIRADEQISMGPVRAVPIEYGNYKGWAFTRTEEE